MGPEIILVTFVVAVGWGIALVVRAVSGRRAVLSTAGAILCLPITVFCVYGFCASFEPGVGLGWKIGYASVAAMFLAASILQTVRVFGTHR